MTDFLLGFREVTGGLRDLCARFKQSLALRSKFAEKAFLLALA